MESVIFFVLLVPNFSIAQYDINSVYMLLSDKIDTVNMEVSFLRNQLQTTRKDLADTKTELQAAQQTIAAMNVNKSIQSTSSKKTKANLASHWIRTDMARVTKAFQAEKAFMRETTKTLKEELDMAKDNLTGTSDAITNMVNMEAHERIAAFSELKRRLDQFTYSMKSLTTNMTDLITDQAEANSLQMLTLGQKLESLDTEMTTWNQRLETQLNEHDTRIDTSIQNQERCQSGSGIGLEFTRDASFPVTSTHYFSPPFKRPPSLVFGSTVLDVANSHNIRYSVYVREITQTYFKIAVTTWSDTTLYTLKLSWMACPR